MTEPQLTSLLGERPERGGHFPSPTTRKPPTAEQIDDTLKWLSTMVRTGGPHPHDYESLANAIDAFNCVHETSASHLSNAVRQVMKPVLDADTMQGFSFRKPHGYAGDFEIIDRIYNGHVCQDEEFARWDLFFHAQAAPRAVRNRKTYLHNLLDDLSGHKPDALVLKVGSGPGRSMYEWFVRQPASQMLLDCIEIDSKAIEHAQRINAPHADRIRYIQTNALRYQPDRTYDLVWSAGLFDYFNDRTFARLIKRYLPCVCAGGELVIGNFSVDNSSRAYMEVIGDWRLNHRSRAELISIAASAGVASQRCSVGHEEEGVNLFLHIRAE